MAKKGHRNQIKLKSSESAHVYFMSKNKNNTQQKLELKKFDPTVGVRKHVLYKETK